MMMSWRPVLTISLCLLVWPFSATAAGVALKDINPKDVEKLKKDLPQLFGNSPDLSSLDQAIRILMTGTAYENIFVNRTGPGQYELIGKPLRTVEEIRFIGRSDASESELNELLQLKTGDRFDRKRAILTGEKMKQFYGERGFFNTVIEVGFEKTPAQNMRILYTIQENTPCTIKTLNFKTANTDLREKLDRRFRRAIGKPLTTERMRKVMRDLNEFLVDNRYLSAEVNGPEVKYNDPKTESFVEFEVVEPFRWEFYFKGNKFMTQVDIYSAMDLTNRDRKNVEPGNEASERLRREYLAAGFPLVQIETKVQQLPGSYLKRVYYTINEGTRVKIKAIEVQGRFSRSMKYYEQFIFDNSSDLVSRRYYSRMDLENGFKNLITELRNQGFLHARMLSNRVEYSEKKDRATVYLMLDEGPQTQIRALDFEGNKFFSNYELATVTELESNAPLKLTEFETSIEKLKTFYRNQGFLEMKLLNENESIIEYNDKGTQARIKFQIQEGPRIRVNNIVIEGNSFTKPYVILKEADFTLGEVLTPQKIEDATARLNRLGLFSRAEIHTREEGTNIAERTLVISITETDPGRFTLGAGVNSERGLTARGFTGIAYNNLYGTGRGVSTRLQLNYNLTDVRFLEHEVTAGYLEPFLLGTRTRGRVNVSQAERVFNFKKNPQTVPDGADEHDLTQITLSNRIDFLIERSLTQATKFTWKTWSLESRKEWERQSRDVDEKGNVNVNNGKVPANVQQIATVGPSVDIDYRDNPFLPTKGTFTRISLNYSDEWLGSTNGINFFHSDASYTHYQRLGSPKLVWANSVHGGYVTNLSQRPNSGVPTPYAFFLGGIYTIRGFDLFSDNERLPKQDDDGFKVNKGNDLLIRTDSHYYLFKSELRFPISGDHGGVVFYDGGSVLVSGYHFRQSYRQAVGFGYRYNTPVGPAAADFAWKIDPQLSSENKQVPERVFRFHLSIGTF